MYIYVTKSVKLEHFQIQVRKVLNGVHFIHIHTFTHTHQVFTKLDLRMNIWQNYGKRTAIKEQSVKKEVGNQEKTVTHQKAGRQTAYERT